MLLKRALLYVVLMIASYGSCQLASLGHWRSAVEYLGHGLPESLFDRVGHRETHRPFRPKWNTTPFAEID